ncbi:alpha/beta fold hydrolase [Aureibacillus halotolerans]|uniref:Cephalosporin-C deacetylase n=1 Tax=Aureibacillus halotolerans TaxID=1508390 RepID=A0A4R6TS45_9BACI|nr:alpha/beta fold hydrolase [Aureibacillus halotolerans]TDQ36428.1 cephalosporin-C deacetylase [Aureibacillus halotolerans]
MPLIDMPLEALYQYQGRNPKPGDFDEYWEQALKELDGTASDVELVPSEFNVPNAECFDLYFTGVKGARIHAKYVRPTNVKGTHPAVVKFHGYTGNAGDWTTLLSLASIGYSAFALDCRGQGGSSEDVGGVKGTTFHGHIIRGLDGSPEDLLFRQIYLDTVQLTRIAMQMEEVDETRVGVQGGSQGGGLALACASLEPRVKKVVSVYPFLSDYLRVWEMDLAKNAYEEIRSYFRRHDPQHATRDKTFTTLGYIDVQHLASRIKGDVLMAVGMMDAVCPPSTQFATYNKIKATKSLEIYPDFAHESLPGIDDKALQFLAQL